MAYAQTDHIVKTGTTSKWVYPGGYRNIAIDSNGWIWVVYTWWPSAPAYTGESIYVDYSDDGGNTWTNSLTIQSYQEDIGGVTHNFIYEQPSIAIDSTNRVYIAYQKSESWAGGDTYTVHSRRRAIGVWGSETDIEGDIALRNDGVSLAIDGNDTVHAVYIKDDGVDNGVRYAKLTVSTWGNFEWLSDAGNYPIIVADDADGLHVIWGNDGDAIKYRYHAYLSTWDAEEDVSDAGTYSNDRVSLAIDSNDDIHVAWDGYDLDDFTQYSFYRAKISGSWGTIENAITEGETPNISIDRADIPWIIALRSTGIVYSRRAGGSWLAPASMSDANGYVGTQMFAIHPTISSVHTNIYSDGFYMLWEHDVDSNQIIKFTEVKPTITTRSFGVIID